MSKRNKRIPGRILAFVLALMLVIGCAPGAVMAQETEAIEEAKVVFTDTPELTNMTIHIGDGPQENARKETLEGKPCLTLVHTTDTLFVYCDVNDGFLNENVNKADITVEYLDKGTGKFSIQLDDKTCSDVVQLEDSGEWKTHTFEIRRFAFGNHMNNADFRIGLWSPEMNGSEGDVSIASITVKMPPVVPRKNASAKFTNPIEENGIDVWTGDITEANPEMQCKHETLQGKECLTFDPATDYLFVYCDIDDNFLNGQISGVTVDVEYLDKGHGAFGLQYTPSECSEVVHLEDSGQWKVHSFKIDYATFANQLNGADFRIGLWTPAMPVSPEPVSFAGVEINIVPVAVNFINENNKTGNIYMDGEVPSLSMNIKNQSSMDCAADISYQVIDWEDNVLLEDSASVELAGSENKTLSLNLPAMTDYGTYSVEMDIVYGDEGQIMHKSIPFSRVMNAGDKQNDMVGVGCHFAQDKGDPFKNLEIAKNAGIRWVRDEVYWDRVETEKGVLEIPEQWDVWVDEAIANGLEPVMILDYSNGFYGEIGSDEWMAGFENYCREITRHFKGRCNTFEIWNEWNGGMGLPHPINVGVYCEIVATVGKAIKEENPDAFIIGGAVAGPDINWLDQMLKYPGVYDVIDAVSMHPYCYPVSPEQAQIGGKIQRLNKIFGSKPAKEIWITELGWPTHTTETGVSEALSGAYAVRTYAWAMANRDLVTNIFWYDLQNDGINSELNEDNFGLIRSWFGSETAPWAAKGNYVALSAFNAKVSGAAFKQILDLGDGVYAYEFRHADGQTVIVMWCDGEKKDVVLSVGKDAVLYDMFGNTEASSASDGIMTVSLSDYPVYLEGTFEKPVAPAEGTVSVETTEYTVSAGSTFEIAVTKTGIYKDMDGSYTLDLPEGFTAEHTEFVPGAAVDKILITVPEGQKLGRYDFTVQANAMDKTVDEFAITVQVAKPYTVEVNPVFVADRGWDHWQIEVVIRNNSSVQPLKGVMEFLAPEEWAGKKPVQAFEIGCNAEKTVIFEVEDKPNQELYRVSVNVAPEGLEPTMVFKPVGFLAAMQAQEPIAVDGVLSAEEWDDTMSFTLGEDHFISLGSTWDELAAKGKLKWDGDYLYLAVDVTDRDHCQNGKEADIWNGDSVQFCLDPAKKIGPGVRGYNEIGFALNSQDQTATSFKWTNAAEDADLSDSSFAVKREGNHTLYEAAIAWKELLPKDMKPEAGENVGFSLLVNNSGHDFAAGATRKGFIEYMSGIGISKNPDMFGDLILVAAPEKPENPFVDVKEGSYYYDSVLWAVDHAITTGRDATHFVPQDECCRKEAVTFLWRANGCPKPETTENPFVDVKEDSYYYDAVLWAYENDITTGKDATHFAPDDLCTRKQIVTFLWRANDCPEPETTENPFVDVKHDGYEKAILWAYENHITTGTTDNTFEPQGICTRGQIVTFLHHSQVK